MSVIKDTLTRYQLRPDSCLDTQTSVMTKQAIRMEICLGMQYKYRHFSQILRDTAWEIIILMKCFPKPEKIVRLLKDQIECKSEEAVNADVITKL